MAIDGFDDADFQELAPKGKASTADMIVSTVTARQPGNVKVQFNIAASLIEEIDAGVRFAIAFAPAKKAFRLKPDPAGRFELMTLPRGKGRHFLRAPLPPGLIEAEGKFEPEFYVDAIGRVIIVECPEELQHKAKLLPAPVPAPTPKPQYPTGARGLESATIAPVHAGDEDPVTDVPRFSISIAPTMIDGKKFHPAWTVTAHLLATRAVVTKEMVLDATLDPSAPEDDERGPKIADVYICKVRPLLAEMGIPVETVWGQGWKITSRENRTKLRNLIELAHMELHS